MSQTTNTQGSSDSKVEIADILRQHIGDYLEKHKMPPDHYKVVYDILNCRTAYLGGHMEKCDRCGTERVIYNSCRNRHCPKCQTVTKERWLSAREADLLPVKYFHNVFTLPHELNPLTLCNKQVMLGLLFKAVSETLLQFGKKPENGLGGLLGFITLLHTWDQELNDHFHLHCLVPGGVLSSDGKIWVDCEDKFLFPVKALSKVFRAKYLTALEAAFKEGQLKFPGSMLPLGTREGFARLLKVLWSKGWVVYIKEPIDRPEWVLDYLSRYTHRIAISNHRIIGLSNGVVTFTVKNRKLNITEKVTLDAVEFIRRFLLHVIPKGFMRIRHHGFLANRSKKKNLSHCRMQMGLRIDSPPVEKKSTDEIIRALLGIDISKCPCCKIGTMKKTFEIPEGSGESSFNLIWRNRNKDGS